jgi:predicted regulator of Ras-like GTPase activity (Roadblock/LC7/MglB family)
MTTEPGGGIGMKRALSALIEKTGALTALLVSKDGIAVAEAGDTSYLNTSAMSALVAGMFAATREVARMVGENQFSMLLQQGENRHLHISLIQESNMMVVIFEGYERIGFVRHECRRVGEELGKAIRQSERKTSDHEKVGGSHFREYALSAIDRIFQTR